MQGTDTVTGVGSDTRSDTGSGDWWPSRFGPEDQAGMLNLITDAKRREALALVREGRMFDLGRVLDEHVPVFPGRHFRQTLVTTAHHGNARGSEQGQAPEAGVAAGPRGLGDNHVNWVIELVSATTQLGTHLDMLNHLQIGDRGYNGWTVAELAEPWGTNRLGAETAPQVVTRGWLADVAAVRGVDALSRGDVVEVEDVEKALGGRKPQPGDAVLLHTGWGRLWTDPARYLDGEPGPGMALARWLVDHGVALTGCDTWSYGPVPAEDPRRPFEVPQWLNVRHGVFVVENLDSAELAAAGVLTFALVLTHPKLRGATGGWTSPLALV
jgi:kynurenine formamidase